MSNSMSTLGPETRFDVRGWTWEYGQQKSQKSFTGKITPCLSCPQTPLSNLRYDTIISQGLSHRANSHCAPTLVPFTHQLSAPRLQWPCRPHSERCFCPQGTLKSPSHRGLWGMEDLYPQGQSCLQKDKKLLRHGTKTSNCLLFPRDSLCSSPGKSGAA